MSGSSSRRDRGSTSLTAVMLTPVFITLAFAGVQAALWSHARTEARAIARDVAVLVAQRHADAQLVEQSAERNLSTVLGAPEVAVSIDDGMVVVRVTGEAPGMLRGTTSPVDVTEALPVEAVR